MNTIGQLISKYRRQANMTQKELADKLFVTPQAVSRWELNTTEPNLTMLKEIAKQLNISVDYFLKDEIEENSLKIENHETCNEGPIEFRNAKLYKRYKNYIEVLRYFGFKKYGKLHDILTYLFILLPITGIIIIITAFFIHALEDNDTNLIVSIVIGSILMLLALIGYIWELTYNKKKRKELLERIFFIRNKQLKELPKNSYQLIDVFGNSLLYFNDETKILGVRQCGLLNIEIPYEKLVAIKHADGPSLTSRGFGFLIPLGDFSIGAIKGPSKTAPCNTNLFIYYLDHKSEIVNYCVTFHNFDWLKFNPTPGYGFYKHTKLTIDEIDMKIKYILSCQNKTI